MTLTIQSQQSASLIELNVMPNRRKEIQNLAVVWCGMADSVRGEHWQPKRLRDANGGLIAPLLFAFPVTLQLDIDILAAKGAYQLFDGLAAGFFSTAHEGGGQRTLVPSGEADQAGSVLLQVIEGRGTFHLRRLTHLELCDELAKILIACPRFAEQGKTRWLGSVLMR